MLARLSIVGCRRVYCLDVFGSFRDNLIWIFFEGGSLFRFFLRVVG